MDYFIFKLRCFDISLREYYQDALFIPLIIWVYFDERRRHHLAADDYFRYFRRISLLAAVCGKCRPFASSFGALLILITNCRRHASTPHALFVYHASAPIARSMPHHATPYFSTMQRLLASPPQAAAFRCKKDYSRFFISRYMVEFQMPLRPEYIMEYRLRSLRAYLRLLDDGRAFTVILR